MIEPKYKLVYLTVGPPDAQDGDGELATKYVIGFIQENVSSLTHPEASKLIVCRASTNSFYTSLPVPPKEAYPLGRFLMVLLAKEDRFDRKDGDLSPLISYSEDMTYREIEQKTYDLTLPSTGNAIYCDGWGQFRVGFEYVHRDDYFYFSSWEAF